MKKWKKKIVAAGVVVIAAVSISGCQKDGESQVVIQSNADDEAVEVIKKVLDENGYEEKYILNVLGTSELGGKLLAEGTDTEADIVTLSSYYLESAEAENDMFLDITFETDTIDEYPAYYTPLLGLEGSLFMNTELTAKNKIPVPASIKDLADPIYADMISVIDISSSSTAWLMLQALLDNYGEEEAREILTGIYKNAGVHIEKSGSGPIKKIRSGEAVIGFGLRQQAVNDEKEGLPVQKIDPEEGNYVLLEGVAVIDKGDKTNDLAMEMAECIIENGREEIIKTYPVALYNGETISDHVDSGVLKFYPEKLTVDLLKEHEAFSASCK